MKRIPRRLSNDCCAEHSFIAAGVAGLNTVSAAAYIQPLTLMVTLANTRSLLTTAAIANVPSEVKMLLTDGPKAV